jgi:hypothetical protein
MSASETGSPGAPANPRRLDPLRLTKSDEEPITFTRVRSEAALTPSLLHQLVGRLFA